MRNTHLVVVVIVSLALMLLSMTTVLSSPPTWARPGAFIEYRLIGILEANPPIKDLPPHYSAYSIVKFEIISFNNTMAEGKFSVLENNDTMHIFKSFMGYEGMETKGYIRWNENFTIRFPPLYLSPSKLPKDGHIRLQRIITGNTSVTLQVNNAWYDKSTGILLKADYIVDTNVTGEEHNGRYFTHIIFELIGSNFVPGHIGNYTVKTASTQTSLQPTTSPISATSVAGKQSQGTTLYYFLAGFLGLAIIGIIVYYAREGHAKKRRR